MPNFPGFARPKSNFYRLPNDWFDIWQDARESLAQGSQPARIVGPLKIVEYVIKYTWGRTNFDEPIRMSRSDLRKGVRGRQNRRLDKGTGLGSEATISRGISTAIELGLLEQVENNDDPGRQERLYLPHLRPPEEDTEPPESPSIVGFERPTANFFLVPDYWSDISADIRSEILIIAMEYFFRHSWGWQTGPQEIRWMDADDIANGRKYRSDARRGDRYDRGTGYTTRKLRDALEEGVKRALLVWRQGQSGKEYALRMTWMDTVGEDGYFNIDPGENPDFEDQPVEGTDQSVGVKDQTVEGRDQNVEARDQAVDPEDQSVGVKDQTVEGSDQSVEARDQTVDRTYKDTFKNTNSKISLPNTIQTTTAKHRKRNGAVVAQSKNEKTIIFRPELKNGDLGAPQRITVTQAANLILTQNGAWYWSEADLSDPNRAEQIGFTMPELQLQVELDGLMLGQDHAIFDDGQQLKIMPLLEIARLAVTLHAHPPPVIYYSLWQFLDLPEPEGAFGDSPARRRTLFLQLQEQAEAWGDPDLVTALEQTNISADEAQSLVTRYGAGIVGGWLRSLRASSGNVRSLAAVLISQLNKGLSPPGGEMKVAGSLVYER